MNQPRHLFSRLSFTRLAVSGWISAAGLAAAACNSGPTAGAQGQPARPPETVQVAALAPRPVADTSEYVATVRSRRSTEVHPQVDGIVTRIYVASGNRVAAGAPLVQIDPAKQQAAVGSEQAARVAQEANVRYARDELARAQELYAVGAISKQELERAQTSVETAQSALDALKAREEESRVQLRYYRVTAPTAGIVGDIPIRVGDRVTTSSLLTTIDQNVGLEAYIPVPIERAADLRVGLPVRLVGDDRQVLAESRVSFVSPQVDERTQSVLVKAPIQSDRGLRTEQFVRAQVVWRTEPRLLVPALAVARINGRHFIYVAEGAGKGAVARLRPVTLGPLVANDYVILEGVSAGDRAIVSSVQRLTDGAPIAPSGS